MGGTLAIDLGSTSTVVAYQASAGSPPHLVEIAPYSSSDPTRIPSLIWLQSAADGNPLIGRQVLDSGRSRLVSPQLCRDFKRRIGHAAGEGAAPEMIDCLLTPEQAGQLLLQRLWAQLPAGIAPSRLVLTAPIDGYRGYRHWLQGAMDSLEVEEVALVDEPTAAAIGAGLPPGSRVLVVDLGGGTIDISLVALEGGEGRAAPITQLLRFAGRNLSGSRQALRCARIIGKGGLTLGGHDIDRWIAEALSPHDPIDGDLLAVAEQLKCTLSDAERALGVWTPASGPARALEMDRPALEALLIERGLLDGLNQLLDGVLAAARAEGLELGDIDAVLPVGGSSRLPLVRRWLEERLGEVPLRDERPIEAVVLGALALTPGLKVKDVLTRGVSLRCWDRRSHNHRWHPLFLAGQSWPTEQPLELMLACSRDDQRELELVLGEPRSENRSEVVYVDGLPRLRSRPAGLPTVDPWSQQPASLPLEPPGQMGKDRLRLRFRIDGQGLLQLDVEDLQTGLPQSCRPLGLVR